MNNSLEDLFKRMMQEMISHHVIFHIDIIATDRGIEIGARKDDDNYALLSPAGKELVDKVLDVMMEASKTLMDKDGRCSGAQTLVDKRPATVEDDWFERNKVIDD